MKNFLEEHQIQNHLQNFTKELSSYFTDQELKDIFNNHCFIAGGAIRSLYMDTKVNDYDVYFKSWPKALRFLTILNKNRNNWDGVINTKKIGLLTSTKNAITFQMDVRKVQFIIRFIGEPKKVIEEFDFTNSMAYYDILKNKLVLDYKMRVACNTKVLDYNMASHRAGHSFKRVIKFVQNGWTANAETLMEIGKNNTIYSALEADSTMSY